MEVAPRRSAGEADGAHHRFGTRRYAAYLLDAGVRQRRSRSASSDLGRGRALRRFCTLRSNRLVNRSHDFGMGMSQNQRPPRAHEIQGTDCRPRPRYGFLCHGEGRSPACPPTARKARTGEFTPPGRTLFARAKQARGLIISLCHSRPPIRSPAAASPEEADGSANRSSPDACRKVRTAGAP